MEGYYGRFGGAFVPQPLKDEMDKIAAAYEQLKQNPDYIKELNHIRATYQGRPTPVTYACNLSEKIGGAKIYLKREDLNHTGAHKLNHCMAECMIAKHLGKKKVIAETGAGQHGVALATAAAYLKLECDIYMGEVDIEKETPNVSRMRLLGANVIPVSAGQKTLKEAVDAAFEVYLQDPENTMYCIGSVVGPHPFPTMLRDFQSVIGTEAREQMLAQTGRLPHHAVACVGGGSNSIGLFSAFLDDNVQLYGVEPMGKGTKLGQNAATLTYGSEGVMHGFNSIMLKDENGEPAPVYSVASGLDYAGVGPEHAYLHETGRVNYVSVLDDECINAFFTLSRTDGIIPALESAHAVAYAMKLAREVDPADTILVNLSGRGDKDMDFVIREYGYLA